jgi:F-type H+-transporting ATPase subunit delta
MQEKLLGYTDAVLEDLGRDVDRVADELSGFVSLLNSSGDLRAVMSGGAVSVPVGRNILRQLLEGKVSAATLALVSFAVQSGPGADFVSDVAVLAAAVAAKRDGMVRLDEGPRGRSAAAERLDGYASHVLSGADEHRLGEVEDELFRFMRIVEGNPELLAALTTSEAPAEVREGVVRDLLSRRATAQSVRTAAYAARIGRPRDYLVLLDGLVARAAREADRRVADVRSAVDMTPGQRRRLADVISRYTGYNVDVRVTVEPALLGGFVAYVGDTVLDASLRQRLQRAREALLAPPPRTGGAGA